MAANKPRPLLQNSLVVSKNKFLFSWSKFKANIDMYLIIDKVVTQLNMTDNIVF